jgi:hypothetical protein
MNSALRAAGAAAPLLLGLTISENIADQAHRHRCSRQELLAALKVAVARIIGMKAKQRPCEAGDE